MSDTPPRQQPATPTAPRVFLSYARGDDEPFVHRLYADLTAAGFTVWFDRASLVSRGLSFHQEIKDAILTDVVRVVYIGGPKAALSASVREEWQFALECDRAIVVPILRLGTRENIPGELSLLHGENFTDDTKYPAALDKLIASLRAPVPKLGALFAVPSLPPHFLGRPELMRRVRDALLVDLQTPQVITSADARVGMQGMGGIGKSVLAAALARNREVRQSYPDGIVWISCGQNLTRDDLLSRQRDLAKHLGGDKPFDSLPQGQGVLRELLAAKAVLLILDDTWQASDAQAFDVLGPRCRMLVTTRDTGILHALHGEHIPVSLFTEPEALQLLAAAVEIEVAALPPEAREVVAECGCLPLAVALSGGMAKAGHSWKDIVEAFREADLEWAENREGANQQHRTIWNAMKASVDVLSKDEQWRFAELAVFDTDDTVPEATAHVLWTHTGELSDRNCTKLLINLAERSLVQLDANPDASGKPQRRFRLHDLLHDYAVRIVGEPVALHGKLVEAYRKQCPDGWHTGPNDGYFFEKLPHHLIESGRGLELRATLRSLCWTYAKVAANLAPGLIDDFALAEKSLPADSDGILSHLASATKQELPHFFPALSGLAGLTADFVFQQLRNRVFRNSAGSVDLCQTHPHSKDNLLLHLQPLRPAWFSLLTHTSPGRARSIYNGSLRYSRDNTRLFVAGGDRAVKCVHPETGETLAIFECTGRAFCCELFDNDTLIVVGGDMGSQTSDGFIQVFEVATKRSMISLHLDVFAYKICVTAEHSLVVCDTTARLKVFQLPTLEPLDEWVAMEGKTHYTAIASGRDGDVIAVGESHNLEAPCRIRLFRTADRSLIKEWNGPRWGVSALQFSEDGGVLAVGAQDLPSGISVWQIANLQASATESAVQFLDTPRCIGRIKTEDSVLALGVIPNTTKMVACEGTKDRSSDAITLFSIENGNLATISRFGGHPNIPVAVAGSPDGRAMASLHASAELAIWPINALEGLGSGQSTPLFTNHSASAGCDRILSLDRVGRLYMTLTDEGRTFPLGAHPISECHRARLTPAGNKYVSSWWATQPAIDPEYADDKDGEAQWWEMFRGQVPVACFVHELDVAGKRGENFGWAAETQLTVAGIAVSDDSSVAAVLYLNDEKECLIFGFSLCEGAEPIMQKLPIYADYLTFVPGRKLLMVTAKVGKQLAFLNPYSGDSAFIQVSLPEKFGNLTHAPCFAGPNRLIIGADGNNLSLFELIWDKDEQEIAPRAINRLGEYQHPTAIADISASSNGDFLAVTDIRPSLSLFKLPEWTKVAWRPLDQLCNDVYFSSDSRRLLAIGRGSEIASIHYSVMAVPLDSGR
jgi:WD40 repeat protein